MDRGLPPRYAPAHSEAVKNQKWVDATFAKEGRLRSRTTYAFATGAKNVLNDRQGLEALFKMHQNMLKADGFADCVQRNNYGFPIVPAAAQTPLVLALLFLSRGRRKGYRKPSSSRRTRSTQVQGPLNAWNYSLATFDADEDWRRTLAAPRSEDLYAPTTVAPDGTVAPWIAPLAAVVGDAKLDDGAVISGRAFQARHRSAQHARRPRLCYGPGHIAAGSRRRRGCRVDISWRRPSRERR